MKKYLKHLCIRDCIPSSVTKILSMTYIQFGFRHQYSTSHALFNITENIWTALDDGNLSCGVFVDLQKAFDIVDHQTLLAKLNHYGIHEVSNDWLQSVCIYKWILI